MGLHPFPKSPLYDIGIRRVSKLAFLHTWFLFKKDICRKVNSQELKAEQSRLYAQCEGYGLARSCFDFGPSVSSRSDYSSANSRAAVNRLPQTKTVETRGIAA
jgi:hypothetical protein